MDLWMARQAASITTYTAITTHPQHPKRQPPGLVSKQKSISMRVMWSHTHAHAHTQELFWFRNRTGHDIAAVISFTCYAGHIELNRIESSNWLYCRLTTTRSTRPSCVRSNYEGWRLIPLRLFCCRHEREIDPLDFSWFWLFETKSGVATIQ